MLFIKYISACCSWLALGLSFFFEGNLGDFAKQQHRAHIYVIKASSVITDNFLPLLEQFKKKQITALFSTVNHTLHPSHAIDNSKAERIRHIQMENTGSSASCCEILRHWVTALTTRERLRNIKKGKKKDSKWTKTKEGEVQKAAGHNVLCTPKTLVFLNAR